ncbi:uncharacterized protein LOC107884781 [Acyrthosiphon pisum]|uniref:THAP-type domain-containing protein n=1 Tax=Acyrthosiphon pisum TaxID=7029 RepID=A0A8R2HAP4_ACYPI|nr:uncharacterized protein LOC107884781 [Acyrthosiphon pisum]|eukprot:XP_016663083.1 PREDICTED: uncharacterized protein LOC107884781 [Acyrthosiphon pisum]
MPSCYVCKRSRNSTSKLQDITFHKFPTNQAIREKWYDFVIENGLKVDSINKYSIMCSSHFDASLFFLHKNTRNLCKNAVPNIIISRVINAKNFYPEISKVGQSSSFFLEALSDVSMQSNSSTLSSNQSVYVKKPTIVGAVVNDTCCEGVSVLYENSPVQSPTYEIDREKLSISPKESLQLDVFMQPNTSNISSTQYVNVKKPTIVVAGNDICCEGVSVLEENSPVQSDQESFLNSLITLKNKGGNNGGLNYPSDDVITICLQTEKFLKSFNYENHQVFSKLG